MNEWIQYIGKATGDRHRLWVSKNFPPCLILEHNNGFHHLYSLPLVSKDQKQLSVKKKKISTDVSFCSTVIWEFTSTCHSACCVSSLHPLLQNGFELRMLIIFECLPLTSFPLGMVLRASRPLSNTNSGPGSSLHTWSPECLILGSSWGMWACTDPGLTLAITVCEL